MAAIYEYRQKFSCSMSFHSFVITLSFIEHKPFSPRGI